MPHHHDLKVFVVSPKHPAGPTRPGPTLSVEAPTLDRLLPAAKQALDEAGFHRRGESRKVVYEVPVDWCQATSICGVG